MVATETNWFPSEGQVLKELLEVVGATLEAKRISLDSEEKAIIAFFLGKAYKTSQAILLLAEQGYGEDAGLLARGLLNLTINAEWIHQDPKVRATAYVDYDWILRAKLGRKIIQNPSLLGAAYQDKLPEVKKTQAQLEAEAKRVQKAHGYDQHGWSGKTIRSMSEEVGLLDAYDSAYTLLSNMEHSNSRSVNDYIVDGPQGYDIDVAPGPNYVRESLLTAHHLMLRVAKLADEILALAIDKELGQAEREEQSLIKNARKE